MAITQHGGIVPTTSVGNSANFAILAEKVIVEINLTQPLMLEGLHDIYIPTHRPTRDPVPGHSAGKPRGRGTVPIDPAKIAALSSPASPTVLRPSYRPMTKPAPLRALLTEFFLHEVKGRA